MTIGINLLREAREKFATAIAAVKDELKNPDLVEEVKPAAIELGSAFDEHLTDLGNAVQPAPTEEILIEAEPAATTEEAEDKGESKPNTEEPAHETFIERVEDELKGALDSAGNAIGEAKFGD